MARTIKDICHTFVGNRHSKPVCVYLRKYHSRFRRVSIFKWIIVRCDTNSITGLDDNHFVSHVINRLLIVYLARLTTRLIALVENNNPLRHHRGAGPVQNTAILPTGDCGCPGYIISTSVTIPCSPWRDSTKSPTFMVSYPFPHLSQRGPLTTLASNPSTSRWPKLRTA